MRTATPTLLTLSFAMISCGSVEEAPGRSELVVFDSGGVTILDNGSLDGAPSLELSLLTQIGVVEGAAEYQLFGVADARRLADGAIVVANGGSREVKIYEADGTHRVTIGGPGQGPWEFGYPYGLVILSADTIQVQDRSDRVYVTAYGDFVRRETTDRQALDELVRSLGGFSEGGYWLADGSYFAPVYLDQGGLPTTGPLERPPITVARLSLAMARIDSLGSTGGSLQHFVDIGRPRPMSVVPPFATNASWSLAARDGTIVIGDNAHPSVDRFHPDGTHSVIRWSAEAEEVVGAEVEAWKERQRAAGWTQGRLPELERAWAAMDVPSTKPFYDRASAGSDGSIWVRPLEAGGDSTQTWVFAADGRLRGGVRLPSRFSVLDAGPSWVLGVVRDEQDVEFVRLYHVGAPGGA